MLGRPVDSLPDNVRDKPEVEKNKTTTPVVYRNVNGKAVVTPVTVGPSDETHTLILSGLKEGDPVIVGPFKVLDSLQHDQKIKAEAKTDAPAPATKPANRSATRPAKKPATRPATGPAGGRNAEGRMQNAE